MIHKVSTCGCSGMLNACLLMLENPTLSYFCLLLAAGSNGRFLVALSPGSVCFFSPSPFSTALAQKWQSRVTEQSCLQLSVANRVYVMYWTSSTREKKNTYKKQSNFSKQSKHAAMIGCIWHKKKYVLPVDQVRRLRYQLHFLLKATRLSWG